MRLGELFDNVLKGVFGSFIWAYVVNDSVASKYGNDVSNSKFANVSQYRGVYSTKPCSPIECIYKKTPPQWSVIYLIRLRYSIELGICFEKKQLNNTVLQLQLLIALNVSMNIVCPCIIDQRCLI